LHCRAAARGLTAPEYVARLERGQVQDETRELAPLLTVAETYFFRNVQQFDACRELARAYAADPVSADGCLRVLSAGCASGEEAYSLAIVMREVLAGTRCTASIVAIDLNPAMLERAKQARYTEWSLRALGADVRARWFRPSGRDMLLDPEIRDAVRFMEGNLVQPDRELFAEARYDVVFCRNVLMYFSPEKCQQAVASLARALAPAGHLFLGHAETLRGLSQDFDVRHTHEAFYYQRKPNTLASASQRPATTSAAVSSVVVTPTELDAMGWVSAIDRATARVRSLASPKSAGTRVAATTRRSDLDGILELMQHERHSEALELLSSTAPASSTDPERLLVKAMLLIHANHFEAAATTCRQLLQLDELNAGAHYVLALCREAADDPERAIYHDRVAAYLDPDFAMPYVHMGLLLRRTGRREAAQRELAHARALLEHEGSARLHMFGGGFSRSALLAVCTAEPTSPGELA
jgi:chemotaxis protein methyltransferase CheR